MSFKDDEDDDYRRYKREHDKRYWFMFLVEDIVKALYSALKYVVQEIYKKLKKR